MRLAPLWLGLVTTLAWPSLALAHPARASAALLDVGSDHLSAELHIPRDQLGMALAAVPTVTPTGALPDDAALGQYVSDHFAVLDPDGTPYAETLESLEWKTIDDAEHLVVRLAETPPAGERVTSFTLRDDVVLHRVVSHRIYVSLRNDVRMGVLGERSRLIGVLGYQHADLAVRRETGSDYNGLKTAFLLGMQHIATGTDHLLFLLALLLVAPVRAMAGRWAPRERSADGLRRIIGFVTAFSLGHSLTLALGATGLLRLPSAPVELAIAASVLVSALHALRPLIPGKEALIAGLFGLVHGLAFATVLGGLGFDPSGLALGLLGFNLGIEAMQLLIVALVAPLLLLLGRARAYPALRISGAAVAAIAAVGWLLQRAGPAIGW